MDAGISKAHVVNSHLLAPSATVNTYNFKKGEKSFVMHTLGKESVKQCSLYGFR